jgi:hypothetical protein
MFAGTFLYTINTGHIYVFGAKFAKKGATRMVSQFGPRIDSLKYKQVKNLFNI